MSEYGPYIITMFIWVLGGGIAIGDAIDEFKKGHYIRFGFSAMFAISVVIGMAKTMFTY